MFMSENALSPLAFPSVHRMEREVIDAAVQLFHGPADAAGNFTSGGTESIILAVKAAREYARATRPEAGHRGEILLPSTAHPAFDKAAQLLDLDTVRVKIGSDFSYQRTRAGGGGNQQAYDPDRCFRSLPAVRID